MAKRIDTLDGESKDSMNIKSRNEVADLRVLNCVDSNFLFHHFGHVTFTPNTLYEEA